MLVLTRKSGEEIRIGDEITITVLLTGRSRVKLGISGPHDVPVVRSELSTRTRPAGRHGGHVHCAASSVSSSQ